VSGGGGPPYDVPDACQVALGDAWTGFLAAHRRLTRELEAELEARHGLSLSALELLGRLAAARGHELRITDLARAAGLSPTRASRIARALERRGLLQRRSVRGDLRGVRACLTDEGLRVAREAQATHVTGVRRRFLGALGDDGLAALHLVLARLA